MFNMMWLTLQGSIRGSSKLLLVSDKPIQIQIDGFTPRLTPKGLPRLGAKNHWAMRVAGASYLFHTCSILRFNFGDHSWQAPKEGEDAADAPAADAPAADAPAADAPAADAPAGDAPAEAPAGDAPAADAPAADASPEPAADVSADAPAGDTTTEAAADMPAASVTVPVEKIVAPWMRFMFHPVFLSFLPMFSFPNFQVEKDRGSDCCSTTTCCVHRGD